MELVYLQGNMYASMLVMPTALAASYVVAMFGSTAPPYNRSSAAMTHVLAIVKIIPSHMLGYSHAV